LPKRPSEGYDVGDSLSFDKVSSKRWSPLLWLVTYIVQDPKAERLWLRVKAQAAKMISLVRRISPSRVTPLTLMMKLVVMATIE
jgi:hypothetical protein